MAVKIASLEAENVKRVKAVELSPAADGLTVIGGRNRQGKTSVLDAIAWALGGDRMRPSQPHREGAAGDPRLRVELDNGIVVERKGPRGSLKVTDAGGGRAGQKLLDALVGQLALDLPRFLAQSDAEKARTLLGAVGIGDELDALERREKQLYDTRTSTGQIARQKRGAAEEMTWWPDAPAEPVSAAELIREQQGILARNGENERKRARVRSLEAEAAALSERLALAEDALREAERRRDELVLESSRVGADLETARKTAEQLRDESTAEIEASLAEIDAVNAKVRENARRADAEAEADALEARYDELTREIDRVREEKMALLDGAGMPLPGLTVERGRLVYGGAAWDCMSGSDQLKVATAIVRALKPECGFVLVDKLEQFDVETLKEFGEWAETEGLQIIGTRVGTGDECSIIIEDGTAVRDGADAPAPHDAAASGKWVM